MDDRLLEIYKELESVMENQMDETQALQFFDKLTSDDYAKLIEMFSNNNFDNINEATRVKLLKILQNLQNIKK